MRGNLKNEQGFSLVELMIVVAIIGILAALAVPRFQSFQAKAKQTEAKNNLSHIYTLEQTYYGDNDAYSSVLDDIGFRVQGKRKYDYSVAAAGSTFTATATATTTDIIMARCGRNDTWTIDDQKVITSVVDCVKEVTK